MKKRHTPTSSAFQNDQEEHIKVYVRARPMRSQFSKRCLKIIDKGVALRFKDKIHQLYFDGVFQEKASQKQVFDGACKPIINHVLQGKNASLFVYGQTGSGKTFTMGTLEAIKTEQQGLVPLSLKYLIEHLKSNYSEGDWSISLSFMQIYMDQIIDLFNPRNSKLQIREDLEYGETYVENLVIVPIDNYQQSIDLINAGLKYRKVGNQKMNQLSSRSHTIFTIYVSQKISSTQFMSSNFCLIDLAGSERVKKSNSTGIRLEQAKFINTSLSALGNVISGLAQNNSEKYIPYRSSKLTRILKHSLLGKSKVAVISTVDTSQDNTHETYSTLLFADRCKQIRLQNQPMVNIETFYEMDQEKDLRVALEKQQSKEKQYLQMIKTLQDPSRSTQNSQRQIDLSQVIESIYKLLGQINDHLKRLLEGPNGKNSSPSHRKQKQQVTQNTPVSAIKSYLTTLARQTIDHINNLSTIAFGQDGQKSSTSSKNQTEVLTSLLLDSMRQNLKLYESNLIKEGKQSLEKQIALQQYEKQRKQKVLNTIKSKKLKNLQNTFQEIWAENHSSSNPLQSLLNNIRRGQMGLYGERPKKQEQDKQMTNPKEFLKMLTKQESQRRNRQMLIEEDEQRQRQQGGDETKSPSSSQIKYFQGRTPSKHSEDSGGGSQVKQEAKQTNSQIKKLLESLIASKSNFEQKRKTSNE